MTKRFTMPPPTDTHVLRLVWTLAENDPATHASNLNPLREIVRHPITRPKDARRGLVSRVLA